MIFSTNYGKKDVKRKKCFIKNSSSNMNSCGIDIALIYKKTLSKNLIICVDELDLSFGQVKVVFSHSSKGHNGVRGVIKEFGHNKFWKIMIGIGRPMNT